MPKRSKICPRAKSGRGLRGNSSPLNGALTLRFESRMSRGGIFRPIKVFFQILNCGKAFHAKRVPNYVPKFLDVDVAYFSDDTQRAIIDFHAGS